MNSRSDETKQNQLLSLRINQGQNEVIIDFSSFKAFLDGKVLPLTNTQFIIFALLVEKQGEPLTRREIQQKLYAPKAKIHTRAIDMHVSALRKCLGKTVSASIKTIHGVGYLLS